MIESSYYRNRPALLRAKVRRAMQGKFRNKKALYVEFGALTIQCFGE